MALIQFLCSALLMYWSLNLLFHLRQQEPVPVSKQQARRSLSTGAMKREDMGAEHLSFAPKSRSVEVLHLILLDSPYSWCLAYS